ncbi:MAG TPA: hypothetical protein VFN08_20005 [Gemmatimonadales bacterium]|jgi:hypothetical protein|nr:hypothetical protein [Gemmatimonadales bacterium]
MRRDASLVVLLLLGSAPALTGQEATDRERIATVTAGIGNTMGWLGVQGERYFAHERLSAFLGLGYTPSIDLGDPSGLSFAVGGRGFTAGVKHRGFLALSLSQLFVENGDTDNRSRLYGPGVEVGYQFASRGGFTAMLGVGAGYAPGMPEGQSAVGSMIELGFGYTWRR